MGTSEDGMIFQKQEKLELNCYVDAYFAGLWSHEEDQDPVCVKSRTGYVMTLGGCPLIWSSKLQTEISLSTLEAEYIEFSMAMRELVPLRRLLKEICENTNTPLSSQDILHSTVFEDNNGELGLETSPKMTPRTKHIAIKYHWFRDHIGEDKGIILSKIESENQKAEMLTKGLCEVIFKKLRKFLLGW